MKNSKTAFRWEIALSLYPITGNVNNHVASLQIIKFFRWMWKVNFHFEKDKIKYLADLVVFYADSICSSHCR